MDAHVADGFFVLLAFVNVAADADHFNFTLVVEPVGRGHFRPDEAAVVADLLQFPHLV